MQWVPQISLSQLKIEKNQPINWLYYLHFAKQPIGLALPNQLSLRTQNSHIAVTHTVSMFQEGCLLFWPSWQQSFMGSTSLSINNKIHSIKKICNLM